MKDKGFGSLVRQGLDRRVQFKDGDRRPRKASLLEVMMLQVVVRAVKGDSKALRRILKILKDTRPAPAKIAMHLYTLDGDENVIDPDHNVLGPLSAFPNLPDVAVPTPVPKEWLIPSKAPTEKDRRASDKIRSGGPKPK